MKNYYEVLHVANFAEIEVVRAAYRAISKLYHPDTNPTADPNIMVQINIAFEILGNPQKKELYDVELRTFFNGRNTDYFSILISHIITSLFYFLNFLLIIFKISFIFAFYFKSF